MLINADLSLRQCSTLMAAVPTCHCDSADFSLKQCRLVIAAVLHFRGTCADQCRLVVAAVLHLHGGQQVQKDEGREADDHHREQEIEKRLNRKARFCKKIVVCKTTTIV